MTSSIAMLKRAIATLSRKMHESNNEQAVLHQDYARIKKEISFRTPKNPAIYGYKIYSQFDEDGIIDHIFSRIGITNGVFVEIGCSDGLENNTHALLLRGWRGLWIDADARKIRDINRHLIDGNQQLVVKHEFVSVDNVGATVLAGLEALGSSSTDFLSIDIDGDDLRVLDALLKYTQPRVICVEYNAKFPPPIKISVKAAASHSWQGDDYYGASLMAFSELLGSQGYRLITCGLSGVNAFFIRESDSLHFPCFSVEQLFQESRHYLIRLSSGHRPSLKFLADRISIND